MGERRISINTSRIPEVKRPNTKRLRQILTVSLLVVAGLSVLATFESINISQEITEQFETFSFSAESGGHMNGRGIPEDLIAQLGPLDGQTIVGTKNLSGLLRIRLGQAKANKFEDLIRICTRSLRLQMSEEQSRQNAIEAAIKNEPKRRFWATLFDNLFVAVTVIVAVIGAVAGLLQYLNYRRKEAADRATSEFLELCKRLASDDDKDVASALTGMQKFLTAEHKDFHNTGVCGSTRPLL